MNKVRFLSAVIHAIKANQASDSHIDIAYHRHMEQVYNLVDGYVPTAQYDNSPACHTRQPKL